MSITAPNYESGARGPLASRLVDVSDLQWMPTPFKGIEVKTLLKDELTGLMTSLFRWEPGAELPMHEHVPLEQTYVLEGSLVDDDGEVTAGNIVWRPAGSQHAATSPNGAVVLCFFLEADRLL